MIILIVIVVVFAGLGFFVSNKLKSKFKKIRTDTPSGQPFRSRNSKTYAGRQQYP